MNKNDKKDSFHNTLRCFAFFNRFDGCGSENDRDDNVFMKIKTNGTTAITNDVMTNFQTLLQTTIGEILDKNIPFYTTNNKKNCEYCPFNMFCKTPLKQ